MDEQLINTIKRAQNRAENTGVKHFITVVRGKYVATSFLPDESEALEICHPVSDTSWKFNKF